MLFLGALYLKYSGSVNSYMLLGLPRHVLTDCVCFQEEKPHVCKLFALYLLSQVSFDRNSGKHGETRECFIVFDCLHALMKHLKFLKLTDIQAFPSLP